MPSSFASTAAALRRLVVVVMATLVVAAVAASPGHAQTATPSQVVQSFYDVLLGTMKNAQSLGARGRFQKLEPVVRQTYDLPYMTRLAIGAAWGTLPPQTQQEVSDAFARYVVATYADEFDGWSGEKFLVKRERPYGAQVVVETQLVKSNGEPVELDYLMHRTSQGWQVADIYLSGTVSQLAVRRSEFSSVIRTQGIPGLIATLNQKTETLLASAGM